MLGRSIPDSEILLEFTKSSGPGGQNVNKTATKVQLKWSPSLSTAFTEPEKQLILDKLAHRLTQDGMVTLSVSTTRSQLHNKLRAIELLNELVHEALQPASPRWPTRPPRREKLARLHNKKQRGTLKKLRHDISDQDSSKLD